TRHGTYVICERHYARKTNKSLQPRRHATRLHLHRRYCTRNYNNVKQSSYPTTDHRPPTTELLSALQHRKWITCSSSRVHRSNGAKTRAKSREKNDGHASRRRPKNLGRYLAVKCFGI